MKNIIDTLRDEGELKKLWDVLENVDLSELKEGKGSYTIFAPTNDAFNKIPSDQLNDLLENPDELANTINYHTVRGKYTSKDIAKMKKATSMNGEDITIDTSNGVRVNDSKVIKPDVEASNGIIHFVDTVLTPKHHK
ncbi:MAG: fasciclin domain-containing protein [Candidatus Thermoplasmatota archaeon]|nr:fasciclin domain-containing protein [Candidatus Thermoplasmatota archaeon]MBS3789670.1 fasciclin domain-containing protein [Candidatus Thermoplasmatota archaeon]